jgi:Raf kinase inhibitor-like YbhB/YbcL family protein
MKHALTWLALGPLFLVPPAHANETSPAPIEVEISGLDKNGYLGADYAYCIAKGNKPSVPEGRNINPEVSWSGGPKEVKSYVLVVVDTEVPTDFTDAGKKGKTIHTQQARQFFFHAALVDIPPTAARIPAGAISKDGSAPPFGRFALNDYPKFQNLKLDDKTLAAYSNYDGPCPPWNDERIHEYHFQIYALDVASLDGLPEHFTAQDVVKAMNGHVIGEGEKVGNYTLNPALLKK